KRTARPGRGPNPSHTAKNATTAKTIATAIAAAPNSDDAAVLTAGADSGQTRHSVGQQAHGSMASSTAVWPAAAAIITEPTPPAPR
ncbi:unnamed protein product, partial [Ixodes persulcatus]